MTNKLLFTLFVFSAIFPGCDDGSSLNKQKEAQAIKALLQQERKAHFDRNVELFMSEFAEGMISVNKGKVSVATAQENRERIGGYFNRVKFIKWDDVAEPIIRISDDGSMAYAIIQKQVILSTTDTIGKPFIDTTDYAWASIYRKQKGEWKVECNVSTSPQTP